MTSGVRQLRFSERGTVLVVDDDRQIGHVVAFILRAEGYACDVTRTPAEARWLLQTGRVEVCLCDLHLGGDGSGLELAPEIRRAGIALVMMSGSDDTSLAEQALRVGAYDYLVKPFRNSELLITVANAFHRRRLEQEASTAS